MPDENRRAGADRITHPIHPRNAVTITIAEERPDHPDAIGLITELEAHLEPLYPSTSRHGFSVEKLLAENVPFFVLREDGAPAACAGIKLVTPDFGEVKRMYVRPAFRGRGFGAMMLDQLAGYARSRGLPLLRLETGIHQHTAIKVYEAYGFRRIPPFPPYREDPLSICYELRL